MDPEYLTGLPHHEISAYLDMMPIYDLNLLPEKCAENGWDDLMYVLLLKRRIRDNNSLIEDAVIRLFKNYDMTIIFVENVTKYGRRISEIYEIMLHYMKTIHLYSVTISCLWMKAPALFPVDEMLNLYASDAFYAPGELIENMDNCALKSFLVRGIKLYSYNEDSTKILYDRMCDVFYECMSDDQIWATIPRHMYENNMLYLENTEIDREPIYTKSYLDLPVPTANTIEQTLEIADILAPHACSIGISFIYYLETLEGLVKDITSRHSHLVLLNIDSRSCGFDLEELLELYRQYYPSPVATKSAMTKIVYQSAD